MQEALELAPNEDCASRPFSAREWTKREQEIMQGMLDRLRAQEHRWPTDDTEFHFRGPDSDGLRHWIRVPDCAALRSAPELTVVGFFGQARATLDHTPIDELEAAIVDSLDTIPGVLCYYDLELAPGAYGNLILCAAPDAPAHVQGHPRHQRAVELTPTHYHSVRLHNGAVSGRFAGDARLVLERTRYYDFDTDPPWRAVRTLG